MEEGAVTGKNVTAAHSLFPEIADADTRELKRLARSIQRATYGVAEDAYAGGEILARCKQQLPHGQWLPYLDAIGIAPRTAQRWMFFRKKHATLRKAVDAVDERHAIEGQRAPEPEQQTLPLPTPVGQLQEANRELRTLRDRVADLEIENAELRRQIENLNA